MLAQKIGGLRNLLQNKIAHEVSTYYNNNEPNNQPPDLLPIYLECMTMEFGGLTELPGVQETLRALAIWTSTAVHHTNPDWFRRECVYQQVERQMAFFGALFGPIVQALPEDSDEE